LDPRFKLDQFHFDESEDILFKDALQAECLHNWIYWQSKSDSSSSNTIVHQNKKPEGLSLSAIFNSGFDSERVNMVRMFKHFEYILLLDIYILC